MSISGLRPGDGEQMGAQQSRQDTSGHDGGRRVLRVPDFVASANAEISLLQKAQCQKSPMSRLWKNGHVHDAAQGIYTILYMATVFRMYHMYVFRKGAWKSDMGMGEVIWVHPLFSRLFSSL